MDTIRVKLFGGFSIRAGSALISDSSGHSKKMWLLMAYLLCAKGRPIPLAELQDLLWQGKVRSNNPANAIKTAFFRAKSCLDQLYPGAGRQLIHRNSQGYFWNTDMPLALDVDHFDRLCAAAGPDRLDQWQEAVSLYTGGFIPKLRGNPWAAGQASQYLKKYVKTVMAALPLMESAGRWQEAEALCAAALREDPLDQELYCRRMAALMELGQPAAAARVYEDMSQLLLGSSGALPEPRAQALYRKAASRVNNQAVPPAGIAEQLRETPEPGAFCCDYDVFRALYRLQARDAARTGQEACLAVLTAEGRNGKPLSRRSLDLVMDNLRRMIPPLLRQGDAMARCSVCQYVLLLPRASFQNGQMVCRRVRQAFGRQYPHSPAEIQAVVTPLPAWNADR